VAQLELATEQWRLLKFVISFGCYQGACVIDANTIFPVHLMIPALCHSMHMRLSAASFRDQTLVLLQ
jgi:hypothetical protein